MLDGLEDENATYMDQQEKKEEKLRQKNTGAAKNNKTENNFNAEKAIMFYAARMQNMPNYRSIHAGGILISEKSMYCYSALDMPPKGFPTVQWSMLEAEDLGLAKFDILSQRGLGHIKDAIQIIQQNRGETVDIHRIQEFKNDARVNRLLSTGHAMGCFYVESPAMRQLLLKLKCGDYLTLVAASSIIRPGVSQSGMMREYTLRHLDPERRARAHPVLMEIMPDTYGIMVYQEDVIKVAYYFAGMSLSESDVLRRGMSGKYRSREEFQQVKDRFFALCKAKGHADELAKEVWFQIESFAGYSFAKGHSASYAVESYQSLYLKAYYPLEFYVGVINNFGGFYRTEFYVHAARMCGADIQAPCVNHSDYYSNISGNTVHLGLVHIASLEQQVAQQIVAEKNANGPYLSLFDFTERTSAGLEQLKILVRIGAFRFTGKNRKELMWEVHWLHHKTKPVAVTQKLFREAPRSFELPELQHDALEDAYEQIELLGFPLCDPFSLLAETLTERPILARYLPKLLGKRIRIDGYLVTRKATRTHKGDFMSFGTWLDREGHFFDSMHFTNSVHQYPFRGSGIYRMEGVVTDDFGAISIDVQRMEKLAYLPDPKYD
jgi:DNA polymerase III alpha subunit